MKLSDTALTNFRSPVCKLEVYKKDSKTIAAFAMIDPERKNVQGPRHRYSS